MQPGLANTPQKWDKGHGDVFLIGNRGGGSQGLGVCPGVVWTESTEGLKLGTLAEKGETDRDQ